MARGAAGALDELLGLDRVGVGGLALDLDVVLLAANLAELSLDRHAHAGAGVGNGLGQGDVVLEGLVGAVDHDGGVASAKGLHAAIIAVAVIEVQGHGHGSALSGGLDHAVEIIEAGLLDGARGGLHDDGGLGLLRGGQDGHDELEVLDVEGADGVVVLLRVEQHLLGGYEHERSLPSRPRYTRGHLPYRRHRYRRNCCIHCTKAAVHVLRYSRMASASAHAHQKRNERFAHPRAFRHICVRDKTKEKQTLFVSQKENNAK